MQHVARHTIPRAPSAGAPRESVFAMLAAVARGLSYYELAVMAAASGTVALAAAIFHRTSWMLMAACYVAWCFAGWGILFHAVAPPRSRGWRALQLALVGSATVTAVGLGIGLFFWALGSHWQL